MFSSVTCICTRPNQIPEIIWNSTETCFSEYIISNIFIFSFYRKKKLSGYKYNTLLRFFWSHSLRNTNFFATTSRLFSTFAPRGVKKSKDKRNLGASLPHFTRGSTSTRYALTDFKSRLIYIYTRSRTTSPTQLYICQPPLESLPSGTHAHTDDRIFNSATSSKRQAIYRHAR